MSGFPARIQRSDLGPTFVDAYPVENPETDIGARAFNAAFHQVAGMNLVSPRAIVVAEYSGGALSIQYQAEAWNPNSDQAHPVLSRNGTGLYFLTFDASYADESGVQIPTTLYFVKGSSMTSSLVFVMAQINPSNRLQVILQTQSPDSTPVDVPFVLEVG